MTYLDPPLTHLKKSESDKKIRSKNSIGKNFRFSENRSQKSLIVTTFSEKPDFPKNGSENRKIEKSLIVTTFPFSDFRSRFSASDFRLHCNHFFSNFPIFGSDFRPL